MSNSLDDLYAHSEDGNASEDERLALSPTDGYFGASLAEIASPGHQESQDDSSSQQRQGSRLSANVPRVPNVLVNDPTLRQSRADVKAEEAAEERSKSDPEDSSSPPQPTQDLSHTESQPPEASTSTPSVTAAVQDTRSSQRMPPATNPPSQPPRRLTSERPPPVQHSFSDAPPAYSPASPISYQTNPHTSLSNHSQSHWPSISSEQQPLLPRPDEAVASPVTGSETPGLFNWRRFGRATDSHKPRKWTVLVLAGVLTFTTILIVTISYSLFSSHEKHDFVEEPVKPPGQGDDGKMAWQPLKRCQKAESNRIESRRAFQFNADTDLAILQVRSEDTVPHGREVQTFGDVILRPDTGTSYSSGSILIESISNDESLGFFVDWQQGSGTLKLTSPREITWQPRDVEPCIQIRITLFVPPHALLNTLDLQTQHLNVRIEKGLIMNVAKTFLILSLAGDVISPEQGTNQSVVPYRLETRDIVVQSVNGTISGWFPLYDSLSFATNDGKLAATVGHKLPKSDRAEPSILEASAVSADISIRESVGDGVSRDGASRDHKVDIQSHTGNIHADILYSSSTVIQSQFGNLNVSVLPASARDCLRWGYQYCTITTSAMFGSTQMLVKPPPDFPDPPEILERPHSGRPANMSGLSSLHTSTSGNVEARYPETWQGNIIASTLSGSMSYRGKGLVTKPWDAINKRLVGRKGQGKSLIIVSTSSGNQDLLFGEEDEEE